MASPSRCRSNSRSLFLWRFLLDEVDDLLFELDFVEGVDLLHAGGAGDVHFSEIVADHIEADEIEAELFQRRRHHPADLAIPRR